MKSCCRRILERVLRVSLAAQSRQIKPTWQSWLTINSARNPLSNAAIDGLLMLISLEIFIFIFLHISRHFLWAVRQRQFVWPMGRMSNILRVYMKNSCDLQSLSCQIHTYIYEFPSSQPAGSYAGNGKAFFQQNDKLFKMQNVAYEWFKANTNTNTIYVCTSKNA